MMEKRLIKKIQKLCLLLINDVIIITKNIWIKWLVRIWTFMLLAAFFSFGIEDNIFSRPSFQTD